MLGNQLIYFLEGFSKVFTNVSKHRGHVKHKHHNSVVDGFWLWPLEIETGRFVICPVHNLTQGTFQLFNILF